MIIPFIIIYINKCVEWLTGITLNTL